MKIAKQSRTIKKIFITTFGLSVILGIVFGILYFLPNEIMFKVYNALAVMQKNNDKAITFFEKASEVFPKWDLIAKNNLYGRLYEQQKYEELSDKLNKIINKDCNVQSEKISEYCENIFYLQGLVQYRLGKNKSDNEQNKFYQNAIDEFQKTLAINPDNKWAKENIDFILQQSIEKQKQQQSTKSQKQQDSKDGKNSQDNQDSQSGDKGKNKQDSQQKQNSQQNGQDEQGEKSNKKNQNSEGTGKSDKDEVGKSRLPQNIQDALEEAQKNMEKNQGQEGFNRSKSAAQKNNYRNQDPFEQMIQQFFGGNIGVDTEKNFSQEIQNPNEKDW